MAKREAGVRRPATTTAPPEYAFDFSGGRLCLDFVNTTGGSRTKEHLNTYHDLVSWGRQGGVLSDREAQHLEEMAARQPDEAARTLAVAILLREALFRIFTAAAEHRPQRPEDMEILNSALCRALSHVRIDVNEEGCVRAWAGDAAPDRMLWPVLRSAMDVLTSEEERGRIHECESPTCAWLFMDTSRNHSRRWCDMKSCGNRAKARRYYERHKQQ
jgi:predicted RNA-binding Zn ribbon-like protein